MLKWKIQRMGSVNGHRLNQQHQIMGLAPKFKKSILTEANNVTAINAFYFRNLNKLFFMFPTKESVFSYKIWFSSSFVWPAILAAFATKYGGNSPIAVPSPNKNASKQTAW